jgi:hypothetical protein
MEKYFNFDIKEPELCIARAFLKYIEETGDYNKPVDDFIMFYVEYKNCSIRDINLVKIAEYIANEV